MLKNLTIKNYALIQELEIQPDSGLNIVTGETGAGKSIMLGALGLLMGNRADVKALFNEEEKCIVEGTFDLSKHSLQDFFEENDLDYEDLTHIRREISPNGKSRAFVNDSPVTLDILKELGELLMDIHSQHDTLLLGNAGFQLKTLDAYGQHLELIQNYQIAYQNFRKALHEYQSLSEKAESLKKEFDYNSHLLDELKALQPEKIEQYELESELQVLENAEEIKRKLAVAYQALNHSDLPALQLMKEGLQALQTIGHLSPRYETLKERWNSSLIELLDISQELEMEETKVEADPTRLEMVQDTLNQLYKLQKKHAVDSTEALIQIKEDLQKKVETVLHLDDELSALNAEKEEAYRLATEIASQLSQLRQKEAFHLQEEIRQLLGDLGMPNGNFEIHFSTKELGPDGLDAVQFRFSANKGSTPKALKEVASGGEFSRVMLALKSVLARRAQLPTIIFDEIDTGISGEVAVKVGHLLQTMSNDLQVIVITHLPQIAGKGHTHFFVYKVDSGAKTISKMKKLNTEERINEIAKMIGGQNPSESAMNSAKELLHL
jgi:DNA repair protein RecN (Recombination protein N)